MAPVVAGSIPVIHPELCSLGRCLRDFTSRPPALDTLAIHAGQDPDPLHGAVMTPIVLSSTFAQPAPGQPKRYEYSRSGNPTREALEQCLAALEGAQVGLRFRQRQRRDADASAACSRAATTCCAATTSTAGRFACSTRSWRRLGIQRELRRHARSGPRRRAPLRPNTQARLDRDADQSPAQDLRHRAPGQARARARACLFVVDNTFASPVLQRPLELGASVVMHSTTKYINGHSDVVGGALVTSDAALAERLRFLQNAIGAVPSPFDCYLVLRGLKTLPLRMRRHAETALDARAAARAGAWSARRPLPRAAEPPRARARPLARWRAAAA